MIFDARTHLQRSAKYILILYREGLEPFPITFALKMIYLITECNQNKEIIRWKKGAENDFTHLQQPLLYFMTFLLL